MLAGSIADSKLSTISTAGKVDNSATTATSANTASAIVARDASGDFSARRITAVTFIGPASSISGADINGVAFNGTANISVNATSGTPADLASSAALGSSALAAKADHVHKAPGITSGEATLASDFTLTSSGGYNDTLLEVTLPDIGKYKLSVDLAYKTQAGCGAMYLNWYDNTTPGSIAGGDVTFDQENVTVTQKNGHFERLCTTTATNRHIRIRIYQTTTTTPFCKVLGGADKTVLRYELLGKT